MINRDPIAKKRYKSNFLYWQNKSLPGGLQEMANIYLAGS
jgi:hypothetical protein